jgi:hypothetical protein
VSNVFSLEQLKTANSTRYVEVEGYGGIIRLGTLRTADMIEWVESNEDATKSRFAGLRLLVKSIVDADGNRIPTEQFEDYLEAFKNKDAKENGVLVGAALKLNGFDSASRQARKNDSGEAIPAASLTV